MSTFFKPINAACALAGSAAQLARQIGIKPPTVYHWRDGVLPVSPKSAVRINRLYPQITLQDLRPDDWRDFWPMLATGDAAPPPNDSTPQPA